MRVTVSLRGVLRGYADGRSSIEVELPPQATVADLLARLRDDLPAVERRVRDERGRIRRHVNETCSLPRSLAALMRISPG
jgi:sulfur-carrier protein